MLLVLPPNIRKTRNCLPLEVVMVGQGDCLSTCVPHLFAPEIKKSLIKGGCSLRIFSCQGAKCPRQIPLVHFRHFVRLLIGKLGIRFEIASCHPTQGLWNMLSCRATLVCGDVALTCVVIGHLIPLLLARRISLFLVCGSP